METNYDKIVDEMVPTWVDQKNTVVPSYRFTLDSEGFGMSPWVQRVRYSLRPHRIEIRWIEVVLPDGSNPLKDYLTLMTDGVSNTDQFTLKHYGLDGKVLGGLQFNKCLLLDHFVEFSYGESSPASHKMTFSFDSYVFV